MLDGVVKYEATLIKGEPPKEWLIGRLNNWRTRLFKAGLIGCYPDGTGYGNISKRYIDGKFFVSGTATGSIPELINEHYVEVLEFNLKANSLTGLGTIQPSSEALTHGVIYQSGSNIKWVFHCHSAKLWKRYKNILPTTPMNAKYGTQAMAREVRAIVTQQSHYSPQVIIMGGHEDGLIVYGNDLDKVGERVLQMEMWQSG